MSIPPLRRAGGPREAHQRRSGSGRRDAGAARRAGAATHGERAAQEPSATSAPVPEPVREPAEVPASTAAAPAGELSGLRLLLDQLDALLRDPTLARALSAFAARLAAGLRALAATLRGLWLAFGRRFLLALLALTLPLALLALLTSAGDDERAERNAGDAPARAAPQAAGGSLGGLGMPALAGGPQKVQPMSVALVLDRTYDAASRRRELRALGAWLDEHHAPGTRVSVIDAATARASSPTRGADLARARPALTRTSTRAAIRAALGRGDGRDLLVTLGSAPAPPGAARTLNVATRRGAASTAALRDATHSRVTIDDRRPDALAASIAREVMAISGQRERR